jgi:hypothetical protein
VAATAALTAAPVPAEPTPAEPTPTEPTPTEPTLAEPTLAEPTLAEPAHKPAPIKAAPGVRQQLLAACRAAAVWLQQEPPSSQAEAILAVLQAAIARAEGHPRPPRQGHEPRRQRLPRQGSKESQVIALLRRPEGATLAQIGESTGWQTHTIRGFFAAALKKRHGLAVTSEKPQGGERTYRIAG